MIKKHLSAILDMELIVILAVIIFLCVILTLLFAGKINDFSTKYKKVFYPYVLSFVLFYTLMVFLGHNRLFSEVRNEFLFYQTISFVFGIIHCWVYNNSFKKFESTGIGIELLFGVLIIFYSSVLFMVIYTTLNGIYFTYLMCMHFILFLCPTGINILFTLMMLIPDPEYATWTPDADCMPVKDEEMKNLLLITLLIKKEHHDENYISIRAQAPVRVDFGRFFYLTLKGYNEHNPKKTIELTQLGGECFYWVFSVQMKWYENNIHIDPDNHIGINNITENTVILCERKTEKKMKELEKSTESDEKIYSAGKRNATVEEEQIDTIENNEAKSKIK